MGAPEADARTQDLALRPLAAVDQEPVVAETHDLGRKAAMNGRGGGRCTEKNDVKQGDPRIECRAAAGRAAHCTSTAVAGGVIPCWRGQCARSPGMYAEERGAGNAIPSHRSKDQTHI